MLNKIEFGNQTYAIIIRSSYCKENNIDFFTDNESPLQLGYMSRDVGYIIQPHRHNLVKREVHLTQEVLFIKSGKIRVDFYSDNQNYLKSCILNKGDVILLSNGGHGFKMIENSEIIEVKQGPYCGTQDKVRFESIDEENIDFKNEDENFC
jgi:cupin superfamily acireductone dioxygenase involved in methionine salvage